MRPAHLLPHEDVCPECQGEKRVPDFRECTSSSAEEPFLATGYFIDCTECDGNGVVLNERRESDRESASPLVEAFRQVRKELAEAQADVARRDLRINELVEENRNLRSRVTGVGVAYVRVAS